MLGVMSTLRVLIIDDQPSILMVAQTLFERTFAGVEVLTSESALEGLQLLEQHPCDLVLTDVNMPGKDGFFVLERVKRHSPRTPVLLMSGAFLAEEAKSKGADAFLLKPFDLQKFQCTVTEAMARGHALETRVS